MCISGGTPLSDHNFAMTGPEDCCGSSAGSVEQHRKGSELADSSMSSILKTVNRNVTDTKRVVEDLSKSDWKIDGLDICPYNF